MGPKLDLLMPISKKKDAKAHGAPVDSGSGQEIQKLYCSTCRDRKGGSAPRKKTPQRWGAGGWLSRGHRKEPKEFPIAKAGTIEQKYK